MSRARGPTPFAVVRIAISAVLLVVLARLLDVGQVIDRLAGLSGPWVALGLATSVPQVVLLAWRWRFTAARLGIELPRRQALGEYYLGIFLNQLLPGGVAGDVSRAWRHARTPAPTGQAVRAVILERLSSQLVMTIVALVSLSILPSVPGALRLVTVGVAAAVAWLLMRSAGRRSSGESFADRVRGDAHQALFTREAWPAQLVSAVLVVGSYVWVYLVAARAVGVETPFGVLLPLVAPVLMTMVIPVTVAGWGVREGAAAALWSLVGLTPEDGVAISVSYGLLVLVSSAPGAVVLARILISGRGRRERPVPSESADTGA